MSDLEIRVTGFGGQGVVLLAYVIGHAVAIDAGRHATMIQTFGPEARGSTCSATLVVSDAEVLYPYIRRSDILVVMSNDAYAKYRDELAPDGILVYENNLVEVTPAPGQRVFGAPSTRIAESLKRPIVGNMVMLGVVTAATGITPREVMREAVRGSVPTGTEEINLQGFDAGWAYFEKEYGLPTVAGVAAAGAGAGRDGSHV